MCAFLYLVMISIAISGRKVASNSNKSIVSCKSEQIGISFSAAEYNRSDYLQITLRDRSCAATYDEAHIILTCALTGCGTTVLDTETHLVYSNDVYMIKDTVKGGIVSNQVSRIAFSCSFKKHSMIRQEPQMDVKTSVYATEAGFGQFQLSFFLYESEAFVNKVWNFPLMVSLKDRLYFEVTSSISDENVNLVIERCHASPVDDKESPTKYAAISNRCPIDETLRFHKGTHNTKRFSFEAFKFLVNDTTVYMHCEVYLCQEGRYEKHCSEKCQENKLRSRRLLISKQKRDIEGAQTKESNFYNLDSGPITREINYEQKPEPSSMAIILLSVCVAVMATVLTVLVAKDCYRRRNMMRNGRNLDY